MWYLHSSLNRLDVRTVSQFGVKGPVSSAEIEVIDQGQSLPVGLPKFPRIQMPFCHKGAMRIILAVLLVLPFIAHSAPITFNQDIAPVIHQNCSACHRPGEAAPFSLLTYGDVT
jgi:hypothetical protein